MNLSNTETTLSYKLLKIVFSIYFIAAIIITVVHVYVTYGDAKEQIRQELRDTEQSFKPALATAVWELNDEQLATIANGILHIKHITAVVIKDGKGRTLFEQGVDMDERSYGLFYHDFSVVHDTQNDRYHLADVRFYSSMKVVVDRIYVGVVLLVINAIIKTIILWLLLLWAFKRYIFVPLSRLVQGLERVDLTDSKPHLIELGITEKNELKQIETSFNQMSTLVAQQKEELLEYEKRHAERLQKEVDRQTRKLSQANLELKKSSEAKSEFLAVMSHEIRTPLNGALSMIKLLEKTALNAEQQEYVSAISFSSETLLSIISDVLDMSSIESGNLQIEDTDFELRALVENMIGLFQPKANSSHIDLTCKIDKTIPAMLRGDQARLRQLLFNLIGNALKFTENGEVEVSIMLLEGAQSSDEIPLMFAVRDTGIGVGEDAREAIFRPFTQADSSISRRFGGSGLGLTICKYIVETMGGEIGVESNEGEGSTFWFSLTLSRTTLEKMREPPCSSEQTEVTPVKSLKVLLVEDDMINQRAESALLQIAGHTVTIVDDGHSALKILQGCGAEEAPPFDVILMDIHMPGLSGIETTRQLRQMGGAVSRLPVIALTADVTRQNIDECLAAGINQVISKPIRHEELEASLRGID